MPSPCPDPRPAGNPPRRTAACVPARSRAAFLLAVVVAAASPARGAEDAQAAPPAGHAPVEPSVVRVQVWVNSPDFFSPWQKSGTIAATGSGVIVDGNRILTNAHVVADAVGIEVKRAGSGEQFEAEVSFVGHDCDLALLTVADPAFFEGTRPLPLGDLPPVNAGVETYGFPVGGEALSVTSGVISRIEVGLYAHSREKLLHAQIDAPINEGNSGGPVVRDGRVVGVSMQLLEQAQNVGYMVPSPIVRHFLADVADGRYDGFPRLGAALQPLESPALKQSLGLEPRQSGGLVTRVDFGSPAAGVIERGDVLVEIAGHAVAGDLTVAMPGVGRVSLDAVVAAGQVGDELPVTLLRGGKRRDVAVKLARVTPLVPGRRSGEEPEYFVFGGAVFQPLTGESFELYEEIPPHLAPFQVREGVVTAERRQVILLSNVLPDRVVRGYLDWESQVVRTVDGVVPRDLAHLAQLFDKAKGPWVRIEADDGSLMVLDVAAARSALPRVLAKYGIPHDRSASLGRQPATGGSAR